MFNLIFRNPFKNNAFLVVLILLSNFAIYHVDKNFGYTKTCFTVAAILNILYGIKLTINSYISMNKQNIEKRLTK